MNPELERIREERRAAGLPEVSRQRIWQILMVRQRKCHICGELAITKTHCRKHREVSRSRALVRSRTRRGIPLDAAVWSLRKGKRTARVVGMSPLEARIAAGRCSLAHCGEPLDGKRFCTRHRKEAAEYQTDRKSRLD